MHKLVEDSDASTRGGGLPTMSHSGPMTRPPNYVAKSSGPRPCSIRAGLHSQWLWPAASSDTRARATDRRMGERAKWPYSAIAARLRGYTQGQRIILFHDLGSLNGAPTRHIDSAPQRHIKSFISKTYCGFVYRQIPECNPESPTNWGAGWGAGNQVNWSRKWLASRSSLSCRSTT
jgi:hypothetical protein